MTDSSYINEKLSWFSINCINISLAGLHLCRLKRIVLYCTIKMTRQFKSVDMVFFDYLEKCNVPEINKLLTIWETTKGIRLCMYCTCDCTDGLHIPLGEMFLRERSKSTRSESIYRNDAAITSPIDLIAITMCISAVFNCLHEIILNSRRGTD